MVAVSVSVMGVPEPTRGYPHHGGFAGSGSARGIDPYRDFPQGQIASRYLSPVMRVARVRRVPLAGSAFFGGSRF